MNTCTIYQGIITSCESLDNETATPHTEGSQAVPGPVLPRELETTRSALGRQGSGTDLLFARLHRLRARSTGWSPTAYETEKELETLTTDFIFPC